MSAGARTRAQVIERTHERGPARPRMREHATVDGCTSASAGAAAQGAQAHVRARARVIAAEGANGASASGWIAVAALMCTRPEPCAVALIGTSPDVMSTLGGLRRGDLVEVEGELALADLGDKESWVGIIVATARLVTEVVPEVAHEA